MANATMTGMETSGSIFRPSRKRSSDRLADRDAQERRERAAAADLSLMLRRETRNSRSFDLRRVVKEHAIDAAT